MKQNRRRLGILVATLVFGASVLALFSCNGNDENDTQDNDPPPPSPALCDEPIPQSPGTNFYLDPVKGLNSNPGTLDAPWGSLESVIANDMIQTQAYTDLPYDGTNPLEIKNPGAPVKAGDTLVLLNGHHGEFVIQGAYNEFAITVKAQPGHQPTLSRISLSAGSNWKFDGLEISPSTAPQYITDTLARVESHNWHGPSSHITFANCYLYSESDTASWSEADWNSLACNAIHVSGDCMTIRDNEILNVNFGITVSGNNSLVSGNSITNFAGDGMRGLGNDLVFEYNVVKNCYKVNQNHDDGFQSWSINDDPPRERVVLRGNTIINSDDPDQPFSGALQAIGCFDGPYIDWVVENNLIVTDHWHGISLYGAFNSRIVNNTVVDLYLGNNSKPWIRINPHKDETPSQGCLIRNNIAPTIIATGDTIEDHNYLLLSDDQLFQKPGDFDFHLRKNAVDVIDKGSSLMAPPIDLEGNTRPAGQAIDIGCYEYTAAP